MKRLALVGLAVVLVVEFTDGGHRALQVCAKKVSSGSRPIEAVGTAVAAVVGRGAGGPVNTP
jgi:hypothetical protein